MQLIPAIDLLDGHCVRLLRGDFNQCETYDTPAIDLARSYHAAGAEWLHVVDLAASRDGNNSDTQALFELLSAAPQSIQTGGGVRREEDITDRLEGGAARVIVGSLAATYPSVFCRWLKEFGSEQLVAAIDVNRNSIGEWIPRTHGWTRSAKTTLWVLLDQLCEAGLKHLLCTDISRDGVLGGPNIELYSIIHRRYPELHIQASGGVSSLEDLTALTATGVTGAISGKALLENNFSAEQAVKLLS